MANSRTGGAFGFLRKSIGSVTYSTLKDSKGKRIQVARSKPTEVANPNTVGQILQRMKVNPAARFYSGLEEILSNAFEGVAYGDASRREFMRLALSQNGPFIPKGATRMIPAVYPVSRGSLAGVDLVYGTSGNLELSAYNKKGFIYNFTGGGAGEDEQSEDGLSLSRVVQTYLGADCQITAVIFTQASDGSFNVSYGRFLTSDYTASGSSHRVFIPIGKDSVYFANNSLYLLKGNDEPDSQSDDFAAAFQGVVAGAVILSRKSGDTWLRDNADVVLNDALTVNLYGNEAQQTAIESYQDSANVNQLNSTWYLNLANGQQFPGRLELQNVHLEFSVEQEGEQTTVVQDLIAPVGIQVEADGRIRNYVFADAGGNAIFNVNGNYETVAEPGGAADAKIKWADVLIQTSLYGARISTWKEAYQIQIAS